MSLGSSEPKEDKEKKESMKYQKIIRDLTGNNENIKTKLTQANKTIDEFKNQIQLLQHENTFLKNKVLSLEKDKESTINQNGVMSNTSNNNNELVQEKSN